MPADSATAGAPSAPAPAQAAGSQCGSELFRFLRKAWYVAAWCSEIAEGKPFGRTICNEKLVFFRDAQGRVAALEDRCSHRGLPLSCGLVKQGIIHCGYHGVAYNGSGTCVLIPGQDLIPRRAHLRRYAAVEKDCMVWVWMADADSADPALITDFPWHNDPVHWPHKASREPIAAHYLLTVDNLMDLTHLGFVHLRTIAGAQSDHVEARMTVVPTATGLRFTRLMFEATPPPTYLKGASFAGKIDRWQEFELVLPSNILQWTGGIDAGTGAEDPARRVGGVQIRIFHGITPETPATCHYFWSVAHGHRPDDAQLTERMFQDIDLTIKEDAAVLREQELNLARYPERHYVTIQSDEVRLMARRLLAERLAHEDAGAAVAREPQETALAE